jgi:sorbitol-specific phosphotransferase system component IIBC
VFGVPALLAAAVLAGTLALLLAWRARRMGAA